MTNIYRWTQVAIQKKKKIIKTEFVTSRIFVLFVINILFPPTLRQGLQIYFRLDMYLQYTMTTRKFYAIKNKTVMMKRRNNVNNVFREWVMQINETR